MADLVEDPLVKVQITLTRIDTTLTAFVTEVRQSHQDVTLRITDHEARLRAVEREAEQLRGSRDATRAMLAIVGVLSPLISYVLAKFF